MKIFFKLIFLLLLPAFVSGQVENPNLSSLYSSLSDAKNDTARMDACSNLGSYYNQVDGDSTNFYLEKALAIAIKLNLKFDEASLFNQMGIIQMQQEKFSKSLEFYLKALNIAKDPGIEKTIWKLSQKANPKKARMLLLSDTYDLIGLLNAYIGNWTVNTKNQLKNYLEAEKYAKQAGDKGQIAYINFHMGIAYMSEEKLDSALILIKKAISTFSDLKDQSGLGRAIKYLGDVYEKMGKYDLATKTLLEAIEILKVNNDQLHLGLGYMSLSRLFTDLNNNDTALYYAKESLKIFERRKDRAWKRDSYNLLSYCYDKLGKPDSGIVYLKLSKSLSDSLGAEERKNLLAFQDVVIEEQVKLEKLETEKIQTKSKIRTYSLLSGLVILTLIGLILYRNNKKEKKAKMVLEKTLKELKSTQSQLVQSEKMASLGELTAGIAHEIQNPLNFVTNFSEVNTELINELQRELKSGNKEDAISISNDIQGNSEKINHHAKRAADIVKGMLQHSRTSKGTREPTAFNALAEEYLRLAYHGLRGKNKSFNATLKTDFDYSIGNIDLIPQDVGRVLFNVYNNAFYAVNERLLLLVRPFGEAQPDNHYEPIVSVTTKKSGNSVMLTVSDNGNGIPEAIKDKIFQPFFTTKPTGQGTGLGLSLSYDIVKAHGGEIKVTSTENKGTTFTIQLPIKND